MNATKLLADMSATDVLFIAGAALYGYSLRQTMHPGGLGRDGRPILCVCHVVHERSRNEMRRSARGNPVGRPTAAWNGEHYATMAGALAALITIGKDCLTPTRSRACESMSTTT